MAEVSVTQQNWAAGELSPKMRSRSELPLYRNGAERIVNFFSETAGPARFRPGFQYVQNTRRHQSAWLLPFQFNDSDAYELLFSAGYIRFLRNNGIVTLPAVTISGATAAYPVVVTATSHGYSNGDEVVINGIVGMTQLNNRSFIVANKQTNTFELHDTHDAAVNGLLYTAYVSGGTASKIYEIQSPYAMVDIPSLKIAQNADTMYIVHPNYEPRKLVRLATASWTLGLFTRTTDPFTSKVVISGISQALPAKVTAIGHGYSTGQQIIIEGVVGMVQINSSNAVNNGNSPVYTITKTGTDDFTLNGIDSTNFTAYGSVGYASDKTLLPGAICFYQGRLYYGYSDTYPESFWGSRPLDSSGNPQYDVFTLGGAITDAFKFTLSPISTKVDKIESLVPTLNFLAICTFEGISKADGGTGGEAIDPTNINVSPVVTAGCLQQITPHLLGISMMFIHRSGLIFYSLEFDIFYNAYNALDKTMTNEHWPQSGIIQMCYFTGRPMGYWFVRNDGVLVWLTYMMKESINAADRMLAGGLDSKILSCGVMPRTNQYDQLWVVSERVINGQTCRFVEYMNDDPVIPEEDDYWSGDANQVADDLQWRNAMFEAQKQYVYMDAALSYDGSDYGTIAGAALTPGALTGNNITFTASATVFDATMVGRELWKQSQNGVGSGRALIISYINPTTVICNIETAFDSLTAMPAGQWYVTTDSISGAWHLEGETVRILTDGGEHPEQTVTLGAITLEYQASVVHIGEGYNGLIRSMHLGSGMPSVPSDGRKMLCNRLVVKFLNTLGARYGTDLYHMQDFIFSSPSDLMGRPSPLFSGHLAVPVEDNSDLNKHIYIQQIRPLPCTIEDVVPYIDFDER